MLTSPRLNLHRRKPATMHLPAGRRAAMWAPATHRPPPDRRGAPSRARPPSGAARSRGSVTARKRWGTANPGQRRRGRWRGCQGQAVRRRAPGPPCRARASWSWCCSSSTAGRVRTGGTWAVGPFGLDARTPGSPLGRVGRRWWVVVPACRAAWCGGSSGRRVPPLPRRPTHLPAPDRGPPAPLGGPLVFVTLPVK